MWRASCSLLALSLLVASSLQPSPVQSQVNDRLATNVGATGHIEPAKLPFESDAEPLLNQVRDVRVLIAADVEAVRTKSDTPIFVSSSAEAKLRLRADNDVTISRSGSTLQLNQGAARYTSLLVQNSSDQILTVSYLRGGQWSQPTPYSGSFRVFIDPQGEADLVNLVELENYVASVVAGEVWPNFALEAFRAQAIAARTFVLYQMSRNSILPYDVSSNQGSQVYKGVRDDPAGRIANEAAEYTRGVVLTYNDGAQDKIFCAYYSAACGGSSQSAAQLGAEGNVPPLSGQVKCSDCKIAAGDAYRWGTVRIDVREAFEKLHARYPEVGSLGALTAVNTISRTPSGRPLNLRLIGSSGKSYDILAERFRLALGGSLIKSTDCQIRVAGREIVFENGKGFGHGLGLCQWGMQGKALKGQSAAQILRHYYPGSQLSRAY